MYGKKLLKYVERLTEINKKNCGKLHLVGCIVRIASRCYDSCKINEFLHTDGSKHSF